MPVKVFERNLIASLWFKKPLPSRSYLGQILSTKSFHLSRGYSAAVIRRPALFWHEKLILRDGASFLSSKRKKTVPQSPCSMLTAFFKKVSPSSSLKLSDPSIERVIYFAPPEWLSKTMHPPDPLRYMK